MQRRSHSRARLGFGLLAASAWCAGCSSVDLRVDIQFADSDVTVLRGGQTVSSPYRVEDSFADIGDLAGWRLTLDVEHGADRGSVEIRSFCALSDQPELESEQMDVFVYWGQGEATFQNKGACEGDGQTGVWISRVAQPLDHGPGAPIGAKG